MNTYNIEVVENGFILIDAQGFKSIHAELVDVLRELQESIEPGSRYDEKRVYVIEAPGDKHVDFTDEHGNVIWGKDE